VESDPENDQWVRVVVQGPEVTLSEFVEATSGRHGFVSVKRQAVHAGELDPKMV
jgi:hypothetical protein